MKMQKTDTRQCHIFRCLLAQKMNISVWTKKKEMETLVVCHVILSLASLGKKKRNLCMPFRDTGYRGCFLQRCLDLKITLLIISIHKILN